jgi:heme/copper-type cytochrome/quinol oxidase subunit 4
MSIPQGNNIIVRGSDGTAIGSNNTVTVIKEKHVHDHRSSDRKSDDDAGLVMGLVLTVTMILAAMSYYFALHAQVIYTGVRAVVGSEFALLLFASVKTTCRDNTLPSTKTWVLLVVLVIALVALPLVQEAYLPELSTFATRVRGPIDFWCGLEETSRQVALLHAITATAGFGLGSLLVMVPIGAFALRDLAGIEFSSPRPTSWVLVVFGGALIVGATYLHTESGMTVWPKAFGLRAAWFCSR